MAVPAEPRCSPVRVTAVRPPGRRPCSTTSATVPMFAYSPSLRTSDENPLGVADFRGDGGGHPGEEDAVVKWNQQQLHIVSPIRKVEDLSF